VCAFFCVCVGLCLGIGHARADPVCKSDREIEKSALCSKLGEKGGKKLLPPTPPPVMIVVVVIILIL
jgi:hypothetical protein